MATPAGLVLLAEQLCLLRDAVQSADTISPFLQTTPCLQHDVQLSMHLLSAALDPSGSMARYAASKVRVVPSWITAPSDLFVYQQSSPHPDLPA